MTAIYPRQGMSRTGDGKKSKWGGVAMLPDERAGKFILISALPTPSILTSEDVAILIHAPVPAQGFPYCLAFLPLLARGLHAACSVLVSGSTTELEPTCATESLFTRAEGSRVRRQGRSPRLSPGARTGDPHSPGRSPPSAPNPASLHLPTL